MGLNAAWASWEHLRSLARPGLPLHPLQVVSEVMCWMGLGLGDVMSFLSPLPASPGLLVSAESAGSWEDYCTVATCVYHKIYIR